MQEEIVTEKKIIKGQDEKEKNKKKKVRNDMNEKGLKLDLEQDIAEVIIFHYTNAKASASEIKRFIRYLKYLSKDNNSNNTYTNRAYALYQYLTEQYSNFVEVNAIMKATN